MKKVPFLNWLERWALQVLVKSPNTGMVAVKEMDGSMLFIANSPYDQMPISGPSGFANHLEQAYRQPSYERSEGSDPGIR